MKKLYFTSLVVIVAVAVSTYAYFTYSCRFSLSDKCSGYNFAKTNKLESASDCKYAGRPYFDDDVSEEFLVGCRKYF